MTVLFVWVVPASIGLFDIACLTRNSDSRPPGFHVETVALLSNGETTICFKMTKSVMTTCI